MDIDDESSSKGGKEANGKLVVVVLVGAPGSGKSTFCDHVMRTSARQWVRICQDAIGNGKAGTKAQCIASATRSLRDGKSIFIDRCNLDKEQRAEFLKLGSSHIDIHAVVLDLPAKLCISRSVKRTGHEGNLQGGKAAAVVNRMLQKKELPKLSEGFSRIMFCHNDSDVQSAISTYTALGPSDVLPNGCFGEKKPDAKVQVGIMKFLKKVDAPLHASSKAGSLQDSVTHDVPQEHDSCKTKTECIRGIVDKGVKEDEGHVIDSVCGTSANVPTLAFPSISTADFQFDLEKASDIIVEEVNKFVTKVGNARLVLVDLSHRSKILSLVKEKAQLKNIDSDKFSTFVGNITQLQSEGGLLCHVIANAANWRLKPGGGGVNAAIFSAAGPSLEIATKELAGSLTPGNALVVPLPSTSPLFSKEGVTHVIHVLGPNMNPQRPNCLNDDYVKGCKFLREAYSSLFEGFASIVKSQESIHKKNTNEVEQFKSELQVQLESARVNKNPTGDTKVKREGSSESEPESERNKRCKGHHGELGVNETGRTDEKDSANGENNKSSKAWVFWSEALYRIAENPYKHKNQILEMSHVVVVINDVYPKAKRHILVLARRQGLDTLADVGTEHLPLLRTMHDVGKKWAEKFLIEDNSLIFRLGFHSVPSMRQLHLHVVSQDFDSKQLRNKKHWNSFTTTFFRDSVDVIEEIEQHGRATMKDDKHLLSMELRCHRCRSAHPSIPRLKSHINNCQSAFPAFLRQNGRLVLASDNGGKLQL